jgi:two-component system NarL family response regulator
VDRNSPSLGSYAGDPTLTSREIEILQLVSSGHSNKRIGLTLAISEETAKAHVRNIMAKLGARDRTHAVTLAVRRGIMQL